MKVPSQLQTKRIVSKVKRETGLSTINTTKWYNIVYKYMAGRLLKKLGMDPDEVKNFLASRFMFFGFRSKGILLCPRELGVSASATVRLHDLAVLAHELTHFEQSSEIGHTEFKAKYATSPEKRAYWETVAETACADVYHFFGRDEFIRADDVFNADWQKMYRLSAAEANTAKERYRTMVKRHADERFCTSMGQLVCMTAKDVTGA